jgi:hypothetical protein
MPTGLGVEWQYLKNVNNAPESVPRSNFTFVEPAQQDWEMSSTLYMGSWLYLQHNKKHPVYFSFPSFRHRTALWSGRDVRVGSCDYPGHRPLICFFFHLALKGRIGDPSFALHPRLFALSLLGRTIIRWVVDAP